MPEKPPSWLTSAKTVVGLIATLVTVVATSGAMFYRMSNRVAYVDELKTEVIPAMQADIRELRDDTGFAQSQAAIAEIKGRLSGIDANLGLILARLTER